MCLDAVREEKRSKVQGGSATRTDPEVQANATMGEWAIQTEVRVTWVARRGWVGIDCTNLRLRWVGGRGGAEGEKGPAIRII